MEQERKCIITITPDSEKRHMDIQTGGVSNLEIIEMLSTITKHFAKAICEEYADLTNQKVEDLDTDEFDNYIKFLRETKL